MKKRQCVAMLLAGGRGTRLEELTETIAKPAVPFGGKYRIIDFTLSNLVNSGIDTVGVLTQYQPHVLQNYIGQGDAWGLNNKVGGLSILPPYQCKDGDHWYEGTAHAIYQNLNYLNAYDPEHVLVISGDHIYKMDYNKMLQQHIETKADVTISVIEVPWEEANRFGIMKINEFSNRIVDFEEKPSVPTSNLASMGIYIFNWKTLKKYLEREERNKYSSKDFGKDIIPAMLADGGSLYAYKFSGYWKDVGTLDSYLEANMDLLNKETNIFLQDVDWDIYTVEENYPPQYLDQSAEIKQSLICSGTEIYGEVYKSVISSGVKVGKGSIIKNSVILPNAVIGDKVIIENAIIAENVVIPNHIHITNSTPKEVNLIGKSIQEQMKLVL